MPDPQPPVRYPLRIPPCIELQKLPTNDTPIRARDSVHFIAPADEPVMIQAAEMLCRVIEQAYGYVNPAVQPDFDKEQAKTAVIKASEFKLAGHTITYHRYSERSFIHEWVEGEVYAEHYATLITNWDLEARAIESFPPENATHGQLRERRRQLADLDAATWEVRNRVMSEYQDKYRLAAYELRRSEYTDTLQDPVQVQEMYRGLRTDRIASRIPGNRVFTGPEEVRAAKLVPLYSRDESDRHSFWRERLNNDVIASHIGVGCRIVDVRAMLADPRFNDMINWRLIRICDQIHRRIITPQNTELCSNLDIDDADESENSLRSTVYRVIRDLDTDWRRIRADAPEWGDVPVFNTLQPRPDLGPRPDRGRRRMTDEESFYLQDQDDIQSTVERH